MGTGGDTAGTDMKCVIVKACLVHQPIRFSAIDQAEKKETQFGHEWRSRRISYASRNINCLLVGLNGAYRTGINTAPTAIGAAGFNGQWFGVGLENGGSDRTAQHQAGTVSGMKKSAVPSPHPDPGNLTHTYLVKVAGN